MQIRSTRRIAAAAAMLALITSACSGGSASPAGSAGASAAATQAQGSAASAPATSASAGLSGAIDFWHIQSTGDGPAIEQQAVDRFMADNPGVKVNVVAQTNDAYKTKIKVALGAGNPPCIFPTWGGGPLYEYVKASQVVDLTPYMSANNYKSRFVDAAFTPITFDGKIYGVPVENTAMAVILYNKDLFAKYNLTAPTTWDQLLTVVSTLKSNGVSAFSLANKAKWPGLMYYMYLVDRLGGPDVFASAANRTGGSFTDPVFVQAGQLLQQLVDAGALATGFNGLDYDSGQSRALLYSGKSAMELMGTWEIGTIQGENKDFLGKIGIATFPSVPNGKGNPADLVGTAGDNFYSISTKCSNPEAAFKLVQYLIDDQSVKVRAAAGRIPPVKGFMPSDPLLAQVEQLVQAAPNVQLWYDQYLPPELGQVVLDQTQGLFAKTVTPDAAAQALEAAAKTYFGK